MLDLEKVTAGAGGRRRVAESVAVLAAGDFVNKAARFAAVVVLTRALPLDQYGLLNLGIALGGIAVVITRLGLPDLGARDAALARGGHEALAARIVSPQLAAFTGLTILACATLLAVEPEAVPFALMCAAGSVGLVLSADWLLRGTERMVPLGVATALGGLVALLGAILVSVTSQSALAGLAALAAGELAAAAWAWKSARLRSIPRPTLHGLHGLLREAWPLALAGAVTYAYYANIDTVVLAATRSIEEAGLYSAPYRLFLALNTTAVFAAYALLPLAARAIQARAAADAQRLILGCLPALAGVGLIWLGVAEMAGERLLGALFGAQFAAMSTTFILLCIAVPWYGIGYPVGYSAIAGGRHRHLLVGAAVAAGANILLNLALIPPFGAEGAAIATAVAMIAAAVTWLHVERLLARVKGLVWLLTLLTAAAIAAAAEDAVRTEIGIASLTTGAVLLALGGATGRRAWIRTLRAGRGQAPG